ncbi:MAG: hypothetical protein K9J30_05750 [Bacteroidales bacterium]|nr:hypothetical protein [Bacteroidales bacterium]
MKTLQFTIDNFATDAMTMVEMNFLKGGGSDQPTDLLVPPGGATDDGN